MEASSSQSQPTPAGKSTIKFGVYTREVSASDTIADLRKKYGPMLRIPEDAHAYNGTTRVDENQPIGEGVTLEFIRKTGEKG